MIHYKKIIFSLVVAGIMLVHLPAQAIHYPSLSFDYKALLKTTFNQPIDIWKSAFQAHPKATVGVTSLFALGGGFIIYLWRNLRSAKAEYNKISSTLLKTQNDLIKISDTNINLLEELKIAKNTNKSLQEIETLKKIHSQEREIFEGTEQSFQLILNELTKEQ